VLQALLACEMFRRLVSVLIADEADDLLRHLLPNNSSLPSTTTSNTTTTLTTQTTTTTSPMMQLTSPAYAPSTSAVMSLVVAMRQMRWNASLPLFISSPSGPIDAATHFSALLANSIRISQSNSGGGGESSNDATKKKKKKGNASIVLEQQDAQEFFCCLIDAMNDELKKLKAVVDSHSIVATGESLDGISRGKDYLNENDDDNSGEEWREVVSVSKKAARLLTPDASIASSASSSSSSSSTSSSSSSPTSASSTSSSMTNNSVSQSLIHYLFGGKMKTVVSVRGKPQTISYEVFTSLQVSLGAAGSSEPDGSALSLEKTLLAMAATDALEDYLVEETGERCRATITTTIAVPPRLLVLQIKRFRMDMESGKMAKLHEVLTYPISLTLPKQLYHGFAGSSSGGHHGNGNGTDEMYRLVSVVHHHGEGGLSGHYTADVYDGEKRRWLRINDEKIDVIDAGDVVDSSKAYLLFYQRQDGSKSL
jgi:ubiquitin C-terminal hydrolase